LSDGELRVGEIRLEGVAKSFRAYHARTLKSSLLRLASGKRLTDRRDVLRDVTLHVEPGERLGITGTNGSGKSTLFRILSGITHADHGVVELRGRVSPLIELTSGLVGDMTGAENIRLNATLLGLTRDEVEARFDTIVDFAELHDFVDTPVRYFSSGMQARIGFSIVTHVDGDIILVDEALAVGDLAFQAKCAERMMSLSKAGVTILLISHDPELVNRFCTRVVEIKDGVITRPSPLEPSPGAPTSTSAT
jgi:ABC-2 type transport system ATP-binding protein